MNGSQFKNQLELMIESNKLIIELLDHMHEYLSVNTSNEIISQIELNMKTAKSNLNVSTTLFRMIIKNNRG